MAAHTVDNGRGHALGRRIAQLDAEPARREAVALGLVDALLESDADALTAALEGLRAARADADGERAGWLDAAIAFTHWGLERLPSPAAPAPGTQAHAFLRALDGPMQVSSAELRRRLAVDETQVSRTGRRLLETGLAGRSKTGREVFWLLTPRGRRALAAAPARSSARSAFWQEALRRGFEAAADGPAREGDPLRERIIESTLGLHIARGIQATTREQVAEASGVPLETVEALFPTLDDLIRGCAAHFMESLKLPPSDRAPELFVRERSQPERVHRLVETIFDAYERGGDGIVLGRRESRDLPVVRESVEALEDTLDALVVEALRPQQLGGAEVASLRALTDLEVWRALRDRGATPEAAVDQVSGAVERWLAARRG